MGVFLAAVDGIACHVVPTGARVFEAAIDLVLDAVISAVVTCEGGGESRIQVRERTRGGLEVQRRRARGQVDKKK